MASSARTGDRPEGRCRRARGSARRRRAPRRTTPSVLAGRQLAAGATVVRWASRLARAPRPGPLTRSRGIPRSRGVPRSRDCIPRTREYKESGERGREPRARPYGRARGTTDPHRSGQLPPPHPVPQITNPHARIRDREDPSSRPFRGRVVVTAAALPQNHQPVGATRDRPGCSLTRRDRFARVHERRPAGRPAPASGASSRGRSARAFARL